MAVPRGVPVAGEPEPVGLPVLPVDAVTLPERLTPLKVACGDVLRLWVPLKEPKEELDAVCRGVVVPRELPEG